MKDYQPKINKVSNALCKNRERQHNNNRLKIKR